MPVPLDGLCFGTALWIISSIFVLALLNRTNGSQPSAGGTIGVVITLGVLSFLAFLLYEWFAGRI